MIRSMAPEISSVGACAQGLRLSSSIYFPTDGLPSVTSQEADSTAIWLPEEVSFLPPGYKGEVPFFRKTDIGRPARGLFFRFRGFRCLQGREQSEQAGYDRA